MFPCSHISIRPCIQGSTIQGSALSEAIQWSTFNSYIPHISKEEIIPELDSDLYGSLPTWASLWFCEHKYFEV